MHKQQKHHSSDETAITDASSLSDETVIPVDSSSSDAQQLQNEKASDGNIVQRVISQLVKLQNRRDGIISTIQNRDTKLQEQSSKTFHQDTPNALLQDMRAV